MSWWCGFYFRYISDSSDGRYVDSVKLCVLVYAYVRNSFEHLALYFHAVTLRFCAMFLCFVSLDAKVQNFKAKCKKKRKYFSSSFEPREFTHNSRRIYA